MMRKSVKLTAEEQFQAAQKKANKNQAEKDQATHERNERISTLKSRRLAKEASDRQIAETAAKAKLLGKKKKA